LYFICVIMYNNVVLCHPICYLLCVIYNYIILLLTVGVVLVYFVQPVRSF